MSDIQQRMRERLSSLQPEHLDIEDDSAAHAGHAGARSGGGHYNLIIVSPRFEGLSRVKRHQMVYEALGDLMQTGIHALAIKAIAPNEI
ncbi:BolA family transcriptional regulator [Pseudogulbenkiania sp. MAI-1]|uniref:BolA family protein n=1 Tax=Pseudogulbenkiania sp. MAI-1 TaxID=990370 RepID=UPI00045E8F89|nr:BolA family protein [Pseudogulbenkiania sp. MAI-1]